MVVNYADWAAVSNIVCHQSTAAVLVRSWPIGQSQFSEAALSPVCSLQFRITAGAAGVSVAGGTELQPADTNAGVVRSISDVRDGVLRNNGRQKKCSCYWRTRAGSSSSLCCGSDSCSTNQRGRSATA